MMPSFLFALFATLLVSPVPSAPSHGAIPWGSNGHRIIARVAADRLSKPVLDEVTRLLDGHTLAEASTWADSIRSGRPETYNWHFVDIPVTDTTYDAARWCPQGNCVIAAVDKYLAMLADKSRPTAERSEALKFVVHFVEDMHQPLHSGERGDKGGNDVKLTFLGKQTNLHSVWDSGLLASLGRSDDEMVADLEGLLARRNDLATMTAGTPRDWAMQAHDVSRDVVYKFLPTSLDLDQSYVNSSRSALILQMERASVRLAAVLERSLGR
jgi:nuclease S1